jgi:hypothetical protein
MAEMPEETIVDVIDHAGRPWVVTARPFGNQLIVNFLCRSAARRNKVLDQTSVWREEGWELSRRWLPQSPRPVPEPILQLVEIRLKELMRIQKLQAAAWLAQNPPAPAPVADHFPDTTKMVPAATREAVDADTDDVLTLAAIIREVQGTQRQGAAALAEAILSHRAWPALLPSPTREAEPPTPEAAAAMGAHGGPPSEAERLAFEAWMRGHSWSVAGVWNGTTYTGRPDLEPLWLDTAAMQTRIMWAAWRDRAALATPQAASRVAPPLEPAPIALPEFILALELAEAALTDICRVRDPDGGVAFAPQCAMLALPRVRHALQTWRHHATPQAPTGEPMPQPPEGWYPEFAAWLERQMPANTVIGDPLWWASRIADWLIAKATLKAGPLQQAGAGERELLAAWLERRYEFDEFAELGRPDWGRMTIRITIRAAALLRQVIPQAGAGISDEEWDALKQRLWNEHRCVDMSDVEYMPVLAFGEALDQARTALARWGGAAVQPVPVSRRLPGPEDCDAEGRCWFFISSLGGYDDDWGWKLLDRTYGATQCQTTWLPYWVRALPVLAAAAGEVQP